MPVEVEAEMEYLKQYGSDEESEEEFRGFDLEEERIPPAQPASSPVPIDQSVVGFCGESSEPRTSFRVGKANEEVSDWDQTARAHSCDSSCSFFELRPQRKSGKKTKKETKRENSVKNRRRSHAAILDNCGCLRTCNEKLTRDDRLQFHKTFWDLDNVGQGNLIRQYAHPKPVERRRSRKVATDSAKQLAYTCTLPSSSDVPVTVCRKFFLNTIGFRENCG